MSDRLLNKVAVVTGAGSGIGRAIAVRFLNEGAKVVVFARTSSQLEEIAELAPARVLVVAGDVTRGEELEQLVRATNRRFGNIDILVPAAGVGRYVPFVESDPAGIRELFEVNFTGALETARLFLPQLNSAAAILFITGSLAQFGQPGLGLYHAGKAALAAMARSLAIELAPRGIRVNCIAPGPVETPFWNKLGLSPTKTKRLIQRLKQHIPGEQFATADEIAETAVFLASEAAGNILGQEIICDGGYSIG